MIRSRRILAAVSAALVLGAAPGRAQAGSLAAQCGAADSLRADTAGAAVVIRASVSADELRFATQPAAGASVPGCAGVSPVRVTERRNLPERVQPGVTYRDVYVAVEIVGRLDARCIAALAAGAAQPLGSGPCSILPASGTAGSAAAGQPGPPSKPPPDQPGAAARTSATAPPSTMSREGAETPPASTNPRSRPGATSAANPPAGGG